MLNRLARFPASSAAADSPQAGRLQCLFAEARAAGIPTRVLFGILMDWARLLERATEGDPWHDKLIEAITVADAALYRVGRPLPKALWRALAPIEALETGDDETSALRAAKLLASHFGQLVNHSMEADPETAWDHAAVMLSAIAGSVSAATLEATMTECAQLAYERLFPQHRL